MRYESAGTIEFLVDNHHKPYFLEMNTRIQVEHPITEAITACDLVKQQILIAKGEKLKIRQKEIKVCGHAIECRINAEDPEKNFLPSPGKITRLILPGGPGIRIDTHIYEGYYVPPYYDSLIMKLISMGRDRVEAIERMQRALSETIIEGIKTTIPFYLKLLAHPSFLSGRYYIGFVEKFLEGQND